MCGIVACLACDGQSIESIQIKSMAQIISHRGPDDIGTYISKKTCKFCLGHTRLSIVGPKFGHQPISHPKYVCFLFDVENFDHILSGYGDIGKISHYRRVSYGRENGHWPDIFSQPFDN